MGETKPFNAAMQPFNVIALISASYFLLEKMRNFCRICLKTDQKFKQISEGDENLMINLKICVPEVEWENVISTCFSCFEQLERICAFRNLCIQSFSQWKIKKNEKVESPNYVCNNCGKSFNIRKELVTHFRINHKDKKCYFCKKCNKKYKNKLSCVKHENNCYNNDNNKSKENTNICGTCGGKFANKYLLKRHLVNVHATDKKFECELCESKFVSIVYLKAHKKYHSGERRHICRFCGKGYITASDLYHHEKIHENKRAYRCEVCPKAFNTSSDLHKHKTCVHLDRNQWKYECSYCKRRFPLKTNLDTHIKTHTGEKNYQCQMCDRKFINNSVLKRHVDSHNIGKSFKCKFCLQRYKYRNSLEKHLMKMHDCKLNEICGNK